MKILVTGCSGFVGFHVSKKLLQLSKKIHVIGIDNLNKYYDVKLKKKKIRNFKKRKKLYFL